MPKRHKIPKVIQKELSTIANKLVAIPNYQIIGKSKKKTQKTLRHELGQALIDRGVKETEDKVLINPLNYYTTEEPNYINHKRRLKKAWLNKGWDGITSYLKSVSRLNEEFKNTPEFMPKSLGEIEKEIEQIKGSLPPSII